MPLRRHQLTVQLRSPVVLLGLPGLLVPCRRQRRSLTLMASRYSVHMRVHLLLCRATAPVNVECICLQGVAGWPHCPACAFLPLVKSWWDLEFWDMPAPAAARGAKYCSEIQQLW